MWRGGGHRGRRSAGGWGDRRQRTVSAGPRRTVLASGFIRDYDSNPVGVLACGLMLLAVGSLLHLVPLLSMLFVGAIVRGIGWGGANIGGYTTLASAAPPQRRGEAAGYYTSVVTSVSIAFPAVALWLVTGRDGFQMVFALSAAMALFGLPMAWHGASARTRKRQRSPEHRAR